VNYLGVSVVIPYYYGNKYLKKLSEILWSNIKEYEKKFEGKIEILFVNDSPQDIIDESFLENLSGYYRIIKNEKNYGIHKTRVNGILEAEQEYIWMLDQDDDVSETWLPSQYACIQKSKADMVIANGYRQISGKACPIFKTEKKLKDATTIAPYVAYGNVIASPGQCLIRKEAIPKFWMEHILWENCADDMYLWMLMFGEKRSIVYNSEYLYTHISTGENFSSNEKQTIFSENKVIELLRKSGCIKERYLRFYSKRLKIRNKYFFEIKGKWLPKIYYFVTEVEKFLVCCFVKYLKV